MDKKAMPEMKRVVGITGAIEYSRTIYFDTCAEIAAMSGTFGQVEPWSPGKSHYQLTVDARYDHADVVAWLESFNN